MNQSIQILAHALEVSSLDAYIENGENIVDNYRVRVVDGIPNAETVLELENIYEQLKTIELNSEEKRKLTQLLLLKVSKIDGLPMNYQLTPDSIGFLFAYLIGQLYPQEETLDILDMASGTGNLLLTVIEHLNLEKKNTRGFGVDIDDTLLSVSAISCEWLNVPVQLFHQDGLQDLLLEPVDVAIGDLPVGYYPNDENAQNYKTACSEGHSYAHHLLLEQTMKYVKPNGYGLFLVPTNILETQQSTFLKKWLKDAVYLQGIIQLPSELFKNKQSRKSILLLQNKGMFSKQASKVFLVNMGSLKKVEQLTRFFQQFEEWKSSNLK